MTSERTIRLTRRALMGVGALALLPGQVRAETIQPFSPAVHVLDQPYRPPSGVVVDLTGVTLRHRDRTTLQSLVEIDYQDNVTLQGGTYDVNLAGQGGWREFLMAIKIRSSSNVKVTGATFQNLSGDGIYISHNFQAHPRRIPRAIEVTNCRFLGSNQNRQGISVITVEDLLIQGCTFDRMARMDMPGAIDLEPDESTDTISNVRILGCTITGPGPAGVCIYNGHGRASITGVRIEGFSISGVKTGISMRGRKGALERDITIKGGDLRKCRVGILAQEVRPSVSGVGFHGCKVKRSRGKSGKRK